jgi:signal transduction histidine kinase
MTNLGLIQESRILFYGNMSNLVANGFVMLIILGVRHRRFRSRHEAMATQLVLQQEQARMNEQYLSDQRQLLAMLAHEIRTPLANLRIWMEAGEKGRPAMERAIDDMNRVIERCVHSGQLSDQSLQPRMELLDLAELTRFVCSSSRQPERVLLDLPTDPCLAKTDAQILSIVLSNLLDNAYKYSALNSRITLRLTASTGSQGINGWRWQIENEVGSTGWPEASKLFEKYYRSPLNYWMEK